MRRPALSTTLLAAALAGACGEAPSPTGALSADVAVLTSQGAAPAHYHAHATGALEAPTPRETRAQGQIQLRLSEDGSTLHYKLIVANIENVVAAHLHLGASGEAGPVVAFLYGSVAPGGGRTQGVLAEGEITAASLINSLAGQPLSALIEAIEAGDIYVNVHTNDGVAPANSGPGDFPGGEVRGQLRD